MIGSRIQSVAPPALALFCVCIAGCGGASHGGVRSTPVSYAGTANGAPAKPTVGADSKNGYLNDGDAEKVNDHDGDNERANHEDSDADSSDEYENTSGNDRYHDQDDEAIVTYGGAANATVTAAVTVAVRHYYEDAASGNGLKACSILTASLSKSATEDYGHGSAGPAYLSAGRTCGAVLGLLFKHLGAQLRSGPTAVTGVRISGDRAIALLGSSTMPASDISLQRERGEWKIAQLIGVALP